MDLKALVRSAQAGEELYVTGPHTQWLEMLEEDQVYSDEAIKHVERVLRREFKHERSGRISPSAMGKCPRHIVFGWAGSPQEAPAIDNQEMMDHGTWTHLKWQAEGITMGWMKAGEVWVHDPDLMCGGSMDATLADDSNFELKSAMWNVYSRVVSVEKTPKFENLLQDATYKYLADMDWSSIVYEDRGSGIFHEFRVARDSKLEREVIRRLKSYKGYIEEDELPPMLDECEMRVGTTYKRCPHRRICPHATSVSHAQTITFAEAPEFVRTGERIKPKRLEAPPPREVTGRNWLSDD